MKIADSESIKSGEQELISSIMTTLNPETLSRVASKTLTPENLEFISGDMQIQGDRIVYHMDFKATVTISVTFDRNGELVIPDTVQEQESPEKEYDIAEQEDDNEDTPDFDQGEPVTAEDSEDEPLSEDNENPESDEEDLTAIFSKNRDFWMNKSLEAQEPVAGAPSS